MSVHWSQLPVELLEVIAKKLTVYIDYIRFRAVCSSWRSSVPNFPRHLPCQLPWLMLPKSHRRLSRCGFFSLSENKVHSLNLPEASHSKRLCGSSCGWLIILDETPVITAVNPINRAKINLPHLSSFPNVLQFNLFDIGREYTLRTRTGGVYSRNLKEMRDYFLKKVIFSSSPSSEEDCVAFAILIQTGELAFCNKGDKAWTFIENAESYSEDVIYHNGLFYAVDKSGSVVVCDVNGPSPSVSLVETPQQFGGDMQYLVSSLNELLLVTRYVDLEFEYDAGHPYMVYKTYLFEVFRLDMKGPSWVNIRSLGNQVLFLGENASLSLLASDFSGCKANCIYYTDDYSESNYDGLWGYHDLGIFNLEDCRIEQLQCYPPRLNSREQWPPPVWITPNPW